MRARGRRYLVILAALAGLVGLYAAVGFFLVPRWMRSELVGLAARDFGRKLSLGEVRFNPFTWTLEVGDSSFPDADGRPLIGFGRLRLTLGISSLPRLAPSVSDLVLDRPHVNALVRRDGALNLSDLEKPFARPANAQAPAPRSGLFRLFVDRLAVRNGSATYEDDSRSTPFRVDLDPIAFELLDFSTTGNPPGRYHLTAAISQGGRLDWTGTVRAEPVSLHGALRLDGLSARMVATYLGPILPAEVSRGTVALQGGFAIDSGRQGSTAQDVRMTIEVPEAQVSGLGVRPRQAASDYLQLNRLTLGNAHIDLGQRSIRVGAITLAGAEIRGWLDQGGRLNLLELLGESAVPSAAAAAQTRGAQPAASRPRPSHTPVWRMAAPDVRIEDTRVFLEDRGVRPAAGLMLGPLSARITGYDSSPGSRIRAFLQSAVNGKGQLRLSADGSLQPEALSAKLQLRRIDLRALQPYLSRYTALTLASGFLSGSLAVDRRADGRLGAAGRIDVASLRTVDDDLKLDFVKWKHLHITGLRYLSSPPSLHIERIVAVAPYARIIIGPDGTINLTEALHPRGSHVQAVPAASPARAATAEGNAPSRSAAASMPMTIGLVRIANGTADYADFSIRPNFATGIQDLHGTVKGLSSDPGSRAAVNLEGGVDRNAPVAIAGVVNLLSASTYTDIRMKFRGLELTRMTPYSVRFAGYKIASGTLDADLHYRVEHARLDADHRFVINQLQLGERVESPHAVKLPLRLAVALLKDRDGVIRLGLPVTGSLNNPQFSLGPLIGKALLSVLKKAVAAPFAMLRRLGGGGADLDRVEFAPGSATLLPAARGRMAALAKALAQRPQLHLQVPAVFAPDVDRPALAQRRLRNELLALARSGAARSGSHRGAPPAPRKVPAAEAGQEVLELPAEHYRLLRAAYRSTFGPEAPLPAAAQKVPPFEPAIVAMRSELLKRMQVSDADLQALGESRAQAVQSAILSAGGVDASRIGITPAAPQRADAGRVAAKLGLK